MDKPIDPSDNLPPGNGHAVSTADKRIDPQSDPDQCGHGMDVELHAPTDHGIASTDQVGHAPPSTNESNDLLDADTLIGEAQSALSVPVPGNVVGDYKLIREIARGGMGVVFLAKQISLNRLVALKMILEGDGADDAELRRFENEARAAGGLAHPGIVPVIEVGSYNGCPFYSMAFVDGESLASHLSRGPLPPTRAAEIARDVSRAIAHAHEKAIIHRDIKPANILIDGKGAPKITDFGVCKSLAAQSQITSQGELIGTPHFMPPEQAGTPGATIGPASDVYSIGAVLYAMLTARPPFQAPSPIDVIAQVMTKDPVPPHDLASGIPSDLETIVLKCLSKSPRDRYDTAQLLSEDIERFLSGRPILAKPPGLIKLIRHFIRQHVLLASVSGSLAFLLVLLSILMGLAWLQARSQINQLTELLRTERVGVRRLVKSDSNDNLGVVEYDVRRLSEAAQAAVAHDPQLALHLGVYAGKLALKHNITPPQKLVTWLATLSQASDPENEPPQDLLSHLKSAESQITRDLTQFEQTAYGLFDASHQLTPPSENHSQQERETP